MLKIVLKPHRSALKAGSTTEQKVFALLKLLPSAEAARSRPPIALCLVVDTSGSMRTFADQQTAQRMVQSRGMCGVANQTDGSFQGFNLKLPSLLDLAIEAAHSLVDDPRLQPDDTISVVHFDTDAKALSPQTPLSRKAEVHRAIDSLRDHSGRTRMARGLNCALEQVERLSPQIAKRVLVFTDGATSDERECLKLLPRFSASNTPLIGIGLGDEYNAELLSRMADATQARPYHLQ
jgi:Ca-activated chloride channel family protein